MMLDQYLDEAGVFNASELDKVKFVFFYYFRNKDQATFTMQDIAEWFDQLHFSKPNSSRLKSRIIASRAFVKGASKDTFKLHANTIKALDLQFPGIRKKPETIETDETIIPFDVYDQSRGILNRFATKLMPHIIIIYLMDVRY